MPRVALLDLGAFDVDDDGQPDTKAIAAAVDELVKDKAYLAKPAGDSKGSRPPQGTRGTPGAPAGPAQGTDGEGDAWLRSFRAGGR